MILGNYLNPNYAGYGTWPSLKSDQFLGGFHLPLLRLYRSTHDRVLAFFSPSYRYERCFENFLFGGDYDRLVAFLNRTFFDLAARKGQGNHLRKNLLEDRIRKDYFQFVGSFSEALGHRIAFQKGVQSDWKKILTTRGRRERAQIAIEQMEASALSISKTFSQKAIVPLALNAVSRRVRMDRAELIGSIAEADEAFFSAVKGKRVLVLGPGATEEIEEEFLKSFDVLAAPKLHSGFWAKGIMGVNPSLTIITYLNKKIVEVMGSSGAMTDRVWDFARVKSVEDLKKLERLLTNDRSHGPIIGLVNAPDHLLMDRYGPLMGTTMVYDLLSAQPKGLFVMGFTFFVQEGKAYNRNYDSASHTDEFTLSSLRMHGAFSNFLFLKNLYDFGEIEVDASTAKILSLTSSAYAERLDARFGLSPHGSALPTL